MRLSSLFAVLAVALCVGFIGPAAAGKLSSPEGGASMPCPCHDVDPRSDFWKPFVEGQDATCFQQAMTGGCGQSFFKSAIAEVGEYCMISCGNCPCCSNLLDLAETIGSEFAWAFNATDPAFRVSTAPLTQPGFMATVLVPPNDAMAAVIRRLGGRGAIAADGAKRAALASIVGAHILQPNSEYNAPWSSQFLKRAGGWVLPTYAPLAADGKHGVALKVTTTSSEEGGRVVFTPVLRSDGKEGEGAASASMAADGSGRLDLEACKGWVVGVDQVILP